MPRLISLVSPGSSCPARGSSCLEIYLSVPTTTAEVVATPGRTLHLRLPERTDSIGSRARQADLDLLTTAPPGYLGTTHFDTRRFPPPGWAVQAFSAAAGQGTLACTGYRSADYQ